jgi:hypothetical protein
MASIVTTVRAISTMVWPHSCRRTCKVALQVLTRFIFLGWIYCLVVCQRLDLRSIAHLKAHLFQKQQLQKSSRTGVGYKENVAQHACWPELIDDDPESPSFK